MGKIAAPEINHDLIFFIVAIERRTSLPFPLQSGIDASPSKTRIPTFNSPMAPLAAGTIYELSAFTRTHCRGLDGLYLAKNNLAGSILSALGNLTNLRTLYRYQNKLSGHIPRELGMLHIIEQLGVN